MTTAELVHRLFQRLLLRKPTHEEVVGYEQRMTAGALSPRRLFEALMDSPEFHLIHPEVRQEGLAPGEILRRLHRYRRLDPEDLVRTLYWELLTHPPSPEVLAGLLDRHRTEGATTGQLKSWVLGQEDYQSLCARRRKLLELEPSEPIGLTTSDPSYQSAAPPERLELDSCGRCNMDPPCIMCGSQNDPLSRGLLPPELMDHLEPILPTLLEASLHSSGEPLMNPHLFDLAARLTPRRTKIGFATNAVLLNEAAARSILDLEITWIDVSLDAATEETYRRIRGPHWERVMENLERLCRLRRERGLERPRVTLNMILMRSNIQEAPGLVELAARLGVEEVHYSHLSPLPETGRSVVHRDESTFDYEAERIHHYPELHDRYMERARTLAADLGVAVRYFERVAG